MIRKFFLAAAAVLVSATGLFAQQQIAELPDDPDVRKGVLDNGMTYYIRHNEKPADQAEFWIFDNVGALQEEDNQQGLAHFLEHMAFNGTQNFPGNAMISYLESIGVKFGANLNAFTAQEMTCYNMSNVPVTREGIIDSALLILHDWAYYITLDPEEIDKERGVIANELRQRNTADWRTREAAGKYIYGDNRYATRNIGGYEDFIRTFEHQALRDFYHRWYRTDMQAILVVGDIDVDAVEQKIINLFSSIPAVENPEPKAVITMESNEEPIVGIVTDPELTNTEVTLYIKRQPVPKEYNKTVDVALFDMLDRFFMTIADERLYDIAMQPNAPFISAGLSSGYMNQAMDVTMVMARARENEALSAFEAMYTEVVKMMRYGFTQSEFDRAKLQIERSIQQNYDARNDRRSDEFMWTYIYNYMLNTPMLSAEDEYNLNNALLQSIDLNMLNSFVQQMRITPVNQVVIVMAPDKEGAQIPTAEEIVSAINNVHSAEIEAPADDFVAEPLIPAKTKLKGSKVVSTETDQFGATIWTLKSGERIIVKPTDFKADEVRIYAIAKGGKSALSDDEMMSVEVMPVYMAQSGLGKFSATELSKQLSGKMVSIQPFVGNYSNGFDAVASPKDLETAFQLMYLSFTAPRFNQADFDVTMDMVSSVYKNMDSNPSFLLQKAIYDTMYGGNIRRQILDYDKLQQVDMARMESLYGKLYGNADDFTFIIVGNVDLQTLQPLVEKYIGSLPRTKQSYSWVDDGVRYPEGKVSNRFKVQMETPKASVCTIMTGSMPYTLENTLAMSSLSQLLDIYYLAVMREEKGATYGVSTQGDMAFMPEETYRYIAMFETTELPMTDELIGDIVNGLKNLATEGPKAEDLDKIKEYLIKTHSDNTKQNSYWVNILSSYHMYGFNLDENYDEIVNRFNPEYFKKLAGKVLADGNFMEIVMLPTDAPAAE